MDNTMVKRYMVVGFFVEKTTGEVVSSICPLNEGISKNGHRYAITDTNAREIISGEYAPGTILEGSMTFSVCPGGQTEPKPSLKLGKE